MTFFEEILLYSEEQLETKARQLLRPGETFRIEVQDTAWAGEITIGEDDDFTYLWDSIGFEKRLLLLDALGWLWTRSQSSAVSAPVWNRRRQDVSKETVTRAVRSRVKDPFPDPEDLDPTEVQSVYGLHQHRKKDE